MTPFISVIIPNRNGEKTIGLCLEAALASQYDNFEIVVVDDGSSDNSANIIARYPCRFIRLTDKTDLFSRHELSGAKAETGLIVSL